MLLPRFWQKSAFSRRILFRTHFSATRRGRGLRVRRPRVLFCGLARISRVDDTGFWFTSWAHARLFACYASGSWTAAPAYLFSRPLTTAPLTLLRARRYSCRSVVKFLFFCERRMRIALFGDAYEPRYARARGSSGMIRVIERLR